MKKLITLLSILLFGIFSISSCSNSGSNDSNENNNEKSEEITDIEKMIGFDPNTPMGSYFDRAPSDFCKGFSKKYDDEYNQVDESKTYSNYKNPNDKSCDYYITKYNSRGEVSSDEYCQRNMEGKLVFYKLYIRYTVEEGEKVAAERFAILSVVPGKYYICTITLSTSEESYEIGFNSGNICTSAFISNIKSGYLPDSLYMNGNKVTKEEFHDCGFND